MSLKINISIFIDFVKKLYKNRHMIRSMAVRELKVQYMGSLFGFLWAVLNPLFQLAIYGIVFGVFFKSSPSPIYGTDSFFLYLLCGLVPWIFFAQTLGSSTVAVVSNTNLVKKAVGFPSEILPIITVISNLISHLIGMGVLLIILTVVTSKVPLYTPFIFGYLFFISLFTVGLGWILSSLYVYFRDVNQLVGLATLGLFFFTPIFYSPEIVPPNMLVFLKLNPMFHMVDGYRLLLLAGKIPSAGDFLFLALISTFTFGLGGVFFRKLKPGFAEVL